MIIAEVGKNHLGKIKSAELYVDRLAETDIDGISFQVREKEYYFLPEKAQLKWDPENYAHLSGYVKKQNKKFGIALAEPSLVEFFETLDTDFYKVIRSDINNDELVSKLVNTGKKMFVSTGTCSANEIDRFMRIYGSKSNIVLNHTQLSNKVEDCNLSAIENMRVQYDCDVSYGTHCNNVNVLYMSLCYNPSDILFYVKACNKLKYPDDQHAITLENVDTVCKNLRLLSEAIGLGIKQKIENKIR